MKKSLIFVMVMCTLVISDSVWADIADGLIGYWPLDEGSGTTTADVAPAGHGNDGTLVDGPLWTSGQFGNALSFDGTNDYVLCAERDGTGPGTYHEELMPENFTVSCWTKLDNFAYFSAFVGNGMDTGSDECGFFLYNYGWQNPDAGREFGLAIRTEAGMYYVDTPSVYNTDTWYHLAATYDGAEAKIYVDGQLPAGAYNPMTVGGPIRWVSASSGNYPERFAIGVWLDPGYDLWIDGIIDDVGYWDRALTADEISAIFTKGERLVPPPDPALASNPFPPDEATDVCRNVVLGWTPGDTATGHEVYFGTSDPPAFKTSLTGATTSYTPSGSISHSTQYFWQIVETGAGDPWPGPIWSFTVEPYSYPLSSEQITATASSSKTGKGPENTLSLDGDLHSTDTSAMWLSAGESPGDAWIQYEFDKIYKLHEMWIWNYNGETLNTAFGLRDVTIKYSTNGTDFTTLGSTHEFPRAPGTDGYAHETPIALDGAVAKYLRITANSNWGGGQVDQYGLSEVRFHYIPVRATAPHWPLSSATGVPLDTVLTWSAGREAETHELYFSDDEQAVAEGSVSPVTLPGGGCGSSYGPLSLDLGKTYYWKVNEVNLAEEPNTWEGDVWSFSTPEYVLVEDFEGYSDDPGDEVFTTWPDGFGVGTNGSQIGYFPAVPPDDPHYLEQTIVHGGSWSAPLYYDNTGTVVNSEATRTFDSPQNWSTGGIKVLTLFFYGQQSNSAPSAGEQMYVKLDDAKVVYDGDMADITREQWHQWDIDLASFGINLNSVTTISIGFDKGTTDATGMVFFDDIRLYSYKCVPSRRKPAGDLNNDCRFDPWDLQILTTNWLISTYQINPQDPGTANLIGHWPLEEGTGLTTADVAPAGYANHGDLVDGPMWTTGHDGGNAISFDGIDDYVVCAERFGDSPGTYPAELMPSTFTVSCWAKLDNFVEFSALVGNGMDYGANECGFFFYNYGYYTDNGRNFGLSLETGDSTSDAQYVETASLYETDTWYHLAATYDGQYAAVYVDGELAAGPQDVGGPIKWIDDNTGNYPERFAIGVWLDPGYELWVDGTIDEVRYYSRALSDGEVGWLAGERTPYVLPLHLLLTPTNPEINAYDGDAIPIIDFKDFAALAADGWLDYQLWP